VIGDRDGVVVVPQARIDEIATSLAQVREKEASMGAAIEAGLITPDWVAELLASSRTRLLD
jgi:4-hydroxy-4-methyl-2-oxoglutarate aldolase